MNSWTAAEALALAARHLPLQSLVSQLSPGGRQLADVLDSISSANIRMSRQTTVGLALLLLGTLGRLVCYRRLAKQFRFELSLQKDHKLITDGPYAIVRHPSYTAGLLLLCGAVALDLGQGSLFSELGGFSGTAKYFGVAYVGCCIMFFSPIFKRCIVEDQVLKMHFKEQWEEWAEKTPYRLIPYIF